MTIQSYDIPQQVTSVRLSALTNLSGNYFNGNLNNGIGATLVSTVNGALVVDSVNANIGDRILLPVQSNGIQNGIYVVISAGSANSLWILQRSPDYQSLEQLKLGQFFSVNAGLKLNGNMYVLVEPLPSSVGGGSISFINVTTGGSGGGGPFLRIANNLSDLASLNTSYNNFGLGSGTTLVLTDSNFTGGMYALSNPCPNVIVLNCTVSSNTLQLPSAQGPDAFGLFQGPNIINIGTFRINLVSFLGIIQTPSLPGDNKTYFLTDNSTTGGLWDAIGRVIDIEGNTGSVSFIAGAGMTIINNNNGSLTFSSSGAGTPTTQAAGNFSVNRNIVQTTFTGAQSLPPNVNPGSIVPVYENNMQVSNATISGQTTPILINLAAGGIRAFNVEFDFSASSTSTVQTLIATITVKQNGGPVITTTNQQAFLIGGTSTPIAATISGLVNLNTNDYVYIVFTSSIAAGIGFNYINCTAVDTTIAGLPSTDALVQGTSNLYLSQNGGSTYQNVNGLPVVVGDVASFNTTGGKLSDSGISASSLITSSTTLGGSLSGLLPNPLISAVGIGQIVAITTVSVTSYSMSDNAPINKYVLTNTSLLTITLPVSASITIGHTFSIMGGTSSNFNIAQNAGQSIKTSVGGSSASTTVGVTGFASSSNPTDCIELVYNGGGVFIIVNEQTSGSGIVLN